MKQKYKNIFCTWERAVAKTTISENGLIASHRFPMYKPISEIVDLDYVTIYFITKYSNPGNLNFGTLSPRLLFEDTFAIKITPPR